MFKTADMIDDSRVRSTRKGEISNVTNKQIDLNRERRGTDGMTKPSVNVNVRFLWVDGAKAKWTKRWAKASNEDTVVKIPEKKKR